MAMGLAILFTAIWGAFEGSAAMGGMTVGLPLGGLLGFGIAAWLVLRFWKPQPARPSQA
jgi:Na+/glutamate symporter